MTAERMDTKRPHDRDPRSRGPVPTHPSVHTATVQRYLPPVHHVVPIGPGASFRGADYVSMRALEASAWHTFIDRQLATYLSYRKSDQSPSSAVKATPNQCVDFIGDSNPCQKSNPCRTPLPSPLS